jgi:chromosomal replication initiator protein
VRYVSSETVLNEFVDSIRSGVQDSFKRRYRGVDLLLVDDIQFFEGKEGALEEFFHTFNALHESGRQVVLSSDRRPDDLPTLEDRLRSRFKSGLVTDIQPPDLETRLAILRKKSYGQTTPFPDDVLVYIAANITDSVRELEGALTRVAAFTSVYNKPLSVELAEEVLGDLLADRQPRLITPGLILQAASKLFGLSVDELLSASRTRPLVQARQTAMYVCRELTDLSYPQIAKAFGKSDHTTVIHAVNKIEKQMVEKRQVYDQVNELTQLIKNGEV